VAPAERLASLDAFRGLAIASMVLVTNPGDWGHLHPPLAHAAWHGWTFTDLVFPWFLFAAGLAMPLSLGRRAAAGDGKAALLAATARRAAVIFAVGLALNFIPAFDPATVRIPGVLQRIALCVLLAAPVVIWGGWRSALVAAAALLATYTVPMSAVAVTDANGTVGTGVLEPGRDFASAIDRAVFGAHLWAKAGTWDPEGLWSTLPAAASLLGGVVAGHFVTAQRPARKAPWLLAAGALCLVLGWMLDATLMPINKNLWTPSYAVFMTGWSLVTLSAFQAALDEAPLPARAAARRLALPLTIYGMNALFLFAFSGLVARLLVALTVAGGDGRAVTLKGLVFAPLRALPVSPENASLAYAIAFDLAMFAVALFLWRRRWFIKA
jgi:predicted acyltransferase